MLVWSIGNHMWSLFVPVHVKSWPKVKLGQVGSRFKYCSKSLFQTEALSLVPRKSYICSLFTQSHIKKFRGHNPLKNSITSIWPLNVIQGQKIMRSTERQDLLYVFHVNFGQLNMHHSEDTAIKTQLYFISKVKGQLKYHIWLTICVSYKLWSWHARYRRYSPFTTQLPRFNL